MIRIYSDESCLQDRYFLLGAVWFEKPDILDAIQNLRARHAPRGAAEFKWSKVSQNHLPLYRDLVDIFFDALKAGTLRYACLFVDTKNKEVIRYHNYLKKGYFMLYYQLFLHNSKKGGIYRVRPDEVSMAKPEPDFEELRVCLERGMRKKFEASTVVLPITPLNSKKSNAIQLVDVITGAMGCSINDHFLKKGASQAKTSLMRYILARAERDGYIKIVDDHNITAHRSDVFNIWPFRPKPFVRR